MTVDCCYTNSPSYCNNDECLAYLRSESKVRRSSIVDRLWELMVATHPTDTVA
ncbi:MULTISPECIES: hypothetical protein [unclassified Microcoleus]|uniref:hypothetical protein n=1 Tax=unclassified Microcoleus TaxID=2642155 RepID=UPI002FD1340F